MVGLGVDAVEIERFRKILARRPRLKEKLFTVEERQYVSAHSDPTPSLAARFAAKEATMKALGVGLGAFNFHEVAVVTDPAGKPQLRVTGDAAALARSRGVERWHVSLTHTSVAATAVVLAE